MATPAFNFDFSSVQPMLAALSARYPQLLDYKMREAAMGPNILATEFANRQEDRSEARRDKSTARREGVRARRGAEALARREENLRTGAINQAEMDRRYATSGPIRDATLPGRGFASTQAYGTAQRAQRMAAAGIPMAEYDPLGRMAAAAAGGGAPEAAAANLRTVTTGGCPPGYAPSAFGGCQPSGTRP